MWYHATNNPTGSTLLTDLASIFSWIIGFFTNIFQLFLTQPVLAVIFGVFVAGAVIGLVTRIYRSA